jgi:hypothetical protein
VSKSSKYGASARRKRAQMRELAILGPQEKEKRCVGASERVWGLISKPLQGSRSKCFPAHQRFSVVEL